MKKSQPEHHLIKAINYHKSGKLFLAKEAYELCLKNQENNLIALRNYAVLEKQLCNYESAIEIALRALKINPNDAIVYTNLGNVYETIGKHEEAYSSYVRAIQINPKMDEAKYNLACYYSKKRRFIESKTLISSITSSGYLKRSRILLGKILFDEERMIDAINIFNQILEYDDLNTEILYLRASAYIRIKKIELAKSDLHKILSVDKKHENSIFTLSAISKDSRSKSSPEDYVRKLFDNYAENFESHLVNKLEYKTPQLLFEQFIRFSNNKNKLNILDLGCGTGLAGEAFSRFKIKMDGVDLSDKMIKKCSDRSIYDSLYCDDIIRFMYNSNDLYGLIICSDVLVYLGDLEEFFNLTNKKLRSGGWLSLSVESTHEPMYELKTTRRFGHSFGYINQLACSNNYKVLSIEQKTIRKEDGEDIEGFIVLLQKE